MAGRPHPQFLDVGEQMAIPISTGRHGFPDRAVAGHLWPGRFLFNAMAVTLLNARAYLEDPGSHCHMCNYLRSAHCKSTGTKNPFWGVEVAWWGGIYRSKVPVRRVA